MDKNQKQNQNNEQLNIEGSKFTIAQLINAVHGGEACKSCREGIFYSNLSDEDKSLLMQAMHLDEVSKVFTKQVFLHHAKRLIDENPDIDYHLTITDVENFKLINSIYGEAKADELLRYLGDFFSHCGNASLCGRYAADQFVILCHTDGDFNEEMFNMAAEEIRQNAPVPFVNVKFGTVEHLDRSETISAMCNNAVLALKSIKHKYNSDTHVAFYDEKLMKEHYKALRYEASFQRAINNKEFIVWCQPKYDTVTRELKSAEALVRWQLPDGKMIFPGDFIPVFEANGLIIQLDEYIFRYVCRLQQEMQQAGRPLLPISVNLSRATLYNSGTVGLYKQIIEHEGIDKSLVPIELTESAAIENDKLKEMVAAFRNEGFHVHMDDFGSGYSSITALSVLPFNSVKLDKTVIDNIGNKGGDEVLRHIIEMAHFFDMEVIAEGVEENFQYVFLKKLNCDTVQGYMFGKPMPYEDYRKLLEDSIGNAFPLEKKQEMTESASLGSLKITNEDKMKYLAAIGSIYMTLHVVDLKENTVIEFATTKNVKEHVNRVHNACDQMQEVMTNTVDPAYLADCLEFTNLKTLPARMKGKRTISEEFVGIHFGWFRARFIMVSADENEEPETVIFTTQVIEADKRKEEQLILACHTDELTGVYNRRAFDEALAELEKQELDSIIVSIDTAAGSQVDGCASEADFEVFREQERELAFIMADVNGLKHANDTLGHAAGDELVWGTADCMVSAVGDKGSVYRIGGDEFAAICSVTESELDDICRKLDSKVSIWMGNQVSRLSISFGAVMKSEYSDIPLIELFKVADQRMFQSKAAYYGKNGKEIRISSHRYSN